MLVSIKVVSVVVVVGGFHSHCPGLYEPSLLLEDLVVVGGFHSHDVVVTEEVASVVLKINSTVLDYLNTK